MKTDHMNLVKYNKILVCLTFSISYLSFSISYLSFSISCVLHLLKLRVFPSQMTQVHIHIYIYRYLYISLYILAYACTVVAPQIGSFVSERYVCMSMSLCMYVCMSKPPSTPTQRGALSRSLLQRRSLCWSLVSTCLFSFTDTRQTCTSILLHICCTYTPLSSSRTSGSFHYICLYIYIDIDGQQHIYIGRERCIYAERDIHIDRIFCRIRDVDRCIQRHARMIQAQRSSGESARNEYHPILLFFFFLFS